MKIKVCTLNHAIYTSLKSGKNGYSDLLLAAGDFLHAVQCAAGLEPCNLQVVEAVVQLNLFRLSISVLDFSSQLLTRSEVVQSQNRDLISWLDLKIFSIEFAAI